MLCYESCGVDVLLRKGRRAVVSRLCACMRNSLLTFTHAHAVHEDHGGSSQHNTRMSSHARGSQVETRVLESMIPPRHIRL